MDTNFKLRFDVKKVNGKPYRPSDKDQSDFAIRQLENESFVVKEVRQKPTGIKAFGSFYYFYSSASGEYKTWFWSQKNYDFSSVCMRLAISLI